jgi:hypothetical protein
MLLTTRTCDLNAIHPRLSRVWIKTGDPKLPLKGIWFDESHLHCTADENCASPRESETTELAEDHLLLAA